MSQRAWAYFRGCFGRRPNAFIRPRAPTRTFFSSPAYMMTSRRIPNERSGGSKVLRSSFGAFVISTTIVFFEDHVNGAADHIADIYAALDVDTLATDDTKERAEKFWSSGKAAVEAYFRQEAKEHGKMTVTDGNKALADVRAFSAPDPYNPKKRFVVYQCMAHPPMGHDNGNKDKSMHALETFLMNRLESHVEKLETNRAILVIFYPKETWVTYYDGVGLFRLGFMKFAKVSSDGKVSRIGP